MRCFLLKSWIGQDIANRADVVPNPMFLSEYVICGPISVGGTIGPEKPWLTIVHVLYFATPVALPCSAFRCELLASNAGDVNDLGVSGKICIRRISVPLLILWPTKRE